MVELHLDKLNCILELTDEDFKNLQRKRIVDGETDEFLYYAKVVTIDDNIILIAKESAFKVIEPKIRKEDWKVTKTEVQND